MQVAPRASLRAILPLCLLDPRRGVRHGGGHGIGRSGRRRHAAPHLPHVLRYGGRRDAASRSCGIRKLEPIKQAPRRRGRQAQRGGRRRQAPAHAAPRPVAALALRRRAERRHSATAASRRIRLVRHAQRGPHGEKRPRRPGRQCTRRRSDRHRRGGGNASTPARPRATALAARPGATLAASRRSEIGF